MYFDKLIYNNIFKSKYRCVNNIGIKIRLFCIQKWIYNWMIN